MPTDNPLPVTESDSSAITLRNPQVDDAAAIDALVARTAVLDRNSCYCYLLLCRDFADTSVVAEADGKVVGFVSAYLPPKRHDVVFVWQVAVDDSVRRRGLGLRMLGHVLSSPACGRIHYLEATVSPSNNASRRLFRKFAQSLQVPCNVETGFVADHFGGGEHEEEELFRIGPFTLCRTGDTSS